MLKPSGHSIYKLVAILFLFLSTGVKAQDGIEILRAEIETILDYRIQGGIRSRAELNGCILTIEIVVFDKCTGPSRIKEYTWSVDLSSVGQIESYPWRDKTLLRFGPRTFLGISVSSTPVSQTETGQYCDGREFVEPDSTRLTIFIPGSVDFANKLADHLRNYTLNFCTSTLPFTRDTLGDSN